MRNRSRRGSPPRQVDHPILARYRARASASMERAGLAERRDQLLAGLRGLLARRERTRMLLTWADRLVSGAALRV